MDPNFPSTPPSAKTPPELAGRSEVREKVRVAIARVQRGYPAKSVLLIGLRGVGKTVLLDQMKLDADQLGHCTIRAEVPENRSLPALIAPQLRLAMLRLSKIDKAKEMAQKALRALAGFAKALKVVYSDIEVGIDFEPEPGLADNGDLEGDLTALLVQAGEAARNAGVSLVLFVDELQYVEETQFGALISALHRCGQLKLPVLLVGAGLPQLRGVAGNAKSYAERLFDFVEIAVEG